MRHGQWQWTTEQWTTEHGICEVQWKHARNQIAIPDSVGSAKEDRELARAADEQECKWMSKNEYMSIFKDKSLFLNHLFHVHLNSHASKGIYINTEFPTISCYTANTQ